MTLDFQELLDSHYSDTHTMTEEKGVALELEQKQEMGTVGNLCVADPSKRISKQKGGLDPCVVWACWVCVTFSQ